jgi:hypothetical protein
MQTSIREAIRIAKTVEASIETDDEPAANDSELAPSRAARPPVAGSSERPLAPDGEGSMAPSKLDAVIDEALSEKDDADRKLAE